MEKSLDRKLAAIHADPSGAKDFILADAKDADMALGLAATGCMPATAECESRPRSLAEFRDQIRQIVRQGLVDIVLMSASTSELLTIEEGLFNGSHVTPAVRANDASDIHSPRGGAYARGPSRPFRSTTLDHIRYGRLNGMPEPGRGSVNLGLYSITFNNQVDDDCHALEEYCDFRHEAEAEGFRHFLEIFDPNAPHDLDPAAVGSFVNDQIARTLAGVTRSARPIFLKMAYHGPRALEELVAYDPHLIVGILGGGSGTTYDAFKLLAEAQKYGARAALFGRKINHAECQLAFVEFLRLIVDGLISPEEAVRAYHGVLSRLKIKPWRSLPDDLQLRTGIMSHQHKTSSVQVPADVPKTARPATAPQFAKLDGKFLETGLADSAVHELAKPNFAGMTSAERLAYHQARLKRIFG